MHVEGASLINHIELSEEKRSLEVAIQLKQPKIDP